MHWVIICTAALLAGGLNAIAGGGSFLTFPALVFVGVPPIMANATGTAALLPGYVTGALAFRDDLGSLRNLTMKKLVLFSLLGGLIGASLLLATSDAGFRRIIPWLLLAATCLFAFGGRLANRFSHAFGSTGLAPDSVWPSIVVFLVAIYGGYFNGGLGILLLAAFALLGETNMNSMNGLKNIASVVLTAISVLVYAAGDAINWPLAFAMMACSTLGGYIGGRLARTMPAAAVRVLVIITGALMTLIFFQK